MSSRLPVSKEEEEEGFYFFSIGDFGFDSGALKQTAEAMNRFAERVGAPRFILGLGDNFYNHVNDDPLFYFNKIWRNVFVTGKPFLQASPWYLILGNHDYESNIKHQLDYTSNEKENSDGLWNLPGQYYAKSFPELNIQLFALDTNCAQQSVADSGSVPVNFLCEQRVWLEEQLRNSVSMSSGNDPWRVVIGHHPMYTHSFGHGISARRLRGSMPASTSSGGGGSVEKECSGEGDEISFQKGFRMEKILESGGVHLYISGHEHANQHHKAADSNVQHIVCGNSGADKRKAEGMYKGLDQSANLDWYDPLNRHGFCSYLVKKDTIEISFINALDCSVIETVLVRKPINGLDMGAIETELIKSGADSTAKKEEDSDHKSLSSTATATIEANIASGGGSGDVTKLPEGPTNTNKPTLIFCYGTLMSKYGNNRVIAHQIDGGSPSMLLGRGRTLQRFTMFAAGIPFVNSTIQTSNILGEVWAVHDPSVLVRVDRLEGHPDWYKRSPVEVELDSGEVISAELYFNDTVSDAPGTENVYGDDLVRVTSGDFREYYKPPS